jgi:hypothetical protein
LEKSSINIFLNESAGEHEKTSVGMLVACTQSRGTPSERVEKPQNGFLVFA